VQEGIDGDLHSRGVVILVIVVGKGRRIDETQIGNKEIKRDGKKREKGSEVC